MKTVARMLKKILNCIKKKQSPTPTEFDTKLLEAECQFLFDAYSAEMITKI